MMLPLCSNFVSQTGNQFLKSLSLYTGYFHLMFDYAFGKSNKLEVAFNLQDFISINVIVCAFNSALNNRFLMYYFIFPSELFIKS